MIINDLDDYYIVFDTKNRNIELDTLCSYYLLNLGTVGNGQKKVLGTVFLPFGNDFQHMGTAFIVGCPVTAKSWERSTPFWERFKVDFDLSGSTKLVTVPEFVPINP